MPGCCPPGLGGRFGSGNPADGEGDRVGEGADEPLELSGGALDDGVIEVAGPSGAAARLR